MSLMPTLGQLQCFGLSQRRARVTLVPTSPLGGHGELSPVPAAWHGGDTRALPVLSLPGTSSIKQVQNRNTLKDAIIIIQSILLVVFISIPILLFLDKASDSASSSGDVPSVLPAPQAHTG